MTKHLNKGWMIESGFISYDELKEANHPLAGKPISELNLPKIVALDVEKATIGECLALLKDHPAIPLAENGKLISVVFQKKLLASLVNKKLDKVFLN
jgi:cystathionine beta-synthase